MIENLTDAFFLFLSFENIVVIFIGVLIGTIIGAIPGMTTPMGVALALPFTFTMNPVTGILLLLGVYKGGLYGGVDYRDPAQGAGDAGGLLHGSRRIPHGPARRGSTGP